MPETYERWGGLLPILAGIYLLLLANGVLPRSPLDPLKLERWRHQFRGTINFAAPIVVLIGIFIVCGVFESARVRPQGLDLTKAEGVAMHRVQAGNPGVDGWYDAASTEGSFAVKLPGPFNDFTFESPNDFGKRSKTYAVGLKTAEGLRFSVIERVAAPGDPCPSPTDFAEKFRDSMTNAPRFTTINGFEAVQFNAIQGKEGTYIRYIKIPDRSVIMTLEYPRSQETLAAQVSDVFLMSLELKHNENREANRGFHD